MIQCQLRGDILTCTCPSDISTTGIGGEDTIRLELIAIFQFIYPLFRDHTLYFCRIMGTVHRTLDTDIKS